MSQTLIKKSSAPRRLDMQKGEWTETNIGVLMTCPDCGDGAYLDHLIHADGKVEPSVMCNKCAYHEFIILEGWTGGDRDTRGVLR